MDFSKYIQVVCGEYHKYWLAPGIKNPKADQNTRRMLDFKDPSERRHTQAVQYFGTEVSKLLATFVPSNAPIYVAVVPGHVANSLSAGLQSIVGNHVQATFRVVNQQNLLRRHTTVEKRSKGGDRSVVSILKSVEAVRGTVAQGARVILLDDVTTTGASLEGCTSILHSAGAAEVWPIALMRTTD